ncbi:MAG: single-stranded DNA-specific exonuclease [Thermoplasmata archaeon]|nr:MAG: single-stranded DNA-specific exonuclease [Thermoplasmata archaeon]
MLKKLNGTGLLIHHWDTDGICSAQLLLKHLGNKNIKNQTPHIGNYFLTEEEINHCSQHDFVIIADMALPEENILKIAKNSKVIIFDHHIQKEIKNIVHHNPVAKGADPNLYPSTSWIINKYLNKPINLFAILGIIGDHEHRIKNNKTFQKIISDFCQKTNLTFEDLLKMVYLLDSNYKIGDKKEVEKTPHILLRIDDASEILNNKQWNRNLTLLTNEIETLLKKPAREINDNIVLKKIDTPYNIISTITRKIAWETGKHTVVINTGFFTDKNQIYVRSNINLEPMIKKGVSLGFKAGGKKEVLGAIVPKDKTDFFVEEILNFLQNNRGV